MNNIPLFDLHVHYGGAIPVETIYDIIDKEKHGILNIEQLRQMMTYEGDYGPYEFEKFLRKFDILNDIAWDENKIDICTKSMISMLAKQSIKYAEVRFSINKYIPYLRMPHKDIILLLCSMLHKYGQQMAICVVPILSLRYESDKVTQYSIAKLIDNAEVCDAVAGIDLIGDEQFFDADFFASIFHGWRTAGKGLLAHVGESRSAENVKLAIEKLKIHRISHGIRAADHPDILALAKDHNVAFDVALTSNVLTGVINNIHGHPIIKLLDAGCDVSIGTDDPVILNTTLEHEYEIAQNIIGLSQETIAKMKLTAIRRAFIKQDIANYTNNTIYKSAK
ncbi:MAG: hypothetical protein QXU32_00990 [Nitrososphaerales archaeon]